VIEAVDVALRRFLIREIPIENNEVEVVFDQPKREWSARLSRPTLNIFLFDIRENVRLRTVSWQPVGNGNGNGKSNGKNKDKGTVTMQRTPLRVDLHYMISAWATEALDEHRLLARTLMTLARRPHLPLDLLPRSLQNQPTPISFQVAQLDILRNPTDLWSVLDNEIRPALSFMLTLAMNPYELVTLPLVGARELLVGPAVLNPLDLEYYQPAGTDHFWSVGGVVKSEETIENLRLRLVERGQEIKLQQNGRFTIHKLEPGEYTLELTLKDGEIRHQKIAVPYTEYQIEI
jgi:hypothetical protein